jgi:uncharacterized protein (TIGR03118 family)
MKGLFRRLQRSLRPVCAASPSGRFQPALEMLETRCLMASNFLQTNLVSDIPGLATTRDNNLQNPWGLAANATSPLWVSDNHSGLSTLYNGQGAIVPLVVTIPSETAGAKGSPTGTVANTAGGGFLVGGKSAAFLFATEDGDIDAWAGGASATAEVKNASAIYKGLTMGVDKNGDNLLYAANFGQSTIDVFDQNFLLVQGGSGSSAGKSPIKLAGTFTDPNLPAGYSPFDVQNLNGNLYVEYAVLDPKTGDEVDGAGLGIVDVYSPDGVLLNKGKELITGGKLNAPWGVALAPNNFGSFSNDLLVGNFGDGNIHVYNPNNGKFVGTLTLADGKPFQEDGLWALRFGNGAKDKAGNVLAPTNTLYFTAGLNDEKDGLLGTLQVVPTISRNDPVLPNLPNAPEQMVTTVASNGDVNPYGVAFVPLDIKSGGLLQPGDILVSNFNNKSNVQGTGSTIVRISPNGQHSDFFDGTGQLGLTTALGVLKSGFVLVGNVPTDSNGVAQQGSLIILDSNGKVVDMLTDNKFLDGPWDLTVVDHGNQAQVFVSNVLSGTVTRIDFVIPKGGTPQAVSMTQIASGYATRTDPNALVVGPTGLAYDPKSETLYVASTGDNAIYAIRDADDTQKDRGKGKLVVSDDVHLHGPLGLVIAPNGDLIASNGDAQNPDPNNPNELVEFTPKGKFVGQFQLDPGNPGGAFGIALSTANGELRFAAVDDNTNTLNIWTFNLTPDHGKDHDHDHDHDHDDHADFIAALFADSRHHHGD